MKKSLATFLVSLNLCAVGLAQKIQVGLHSGIGASQYSNFRKTNNAPFGADRVLSGVTGIDIQWNFARRWALATEYNFTEKGQTRYYLQKKSRFIENTASLRFDLRKNASKAVQPFLRAGGYFAVLAAQRERDISGGAPRVEIYLMEYRDVRRIDHGFLGGAGLDWRVGPHVLVSIEGRFEHGLRDAFGANKGEGWSRKKVFHVAAWGITGVKYAF